MKRILIVVALGLAATACGNECDDAVDHAEECGIDMPDNVDTDDCSGKNECAAKCFNEASCADLKSTDLDTPFITCVSKC